MPCLFVLASALYKVFVMACIVFGRGMELFTLSDRCELHLAPGGKSSLCVVELKNLCSLRYNPWC